MPTSLLQRLIDLIVPRSCAICGCRLSPDEEFICLPCNLHLPRTGYATTPYDNELVRCFWGRIRHIEKGMALMQHHGGQQASFPIYSLKYKHNRDIGIFLGQLLAREMLTAGFLDDIDAILPIPLAPKREKERGYNQSEVIAEGMQQLCHLPVYSHAIRRTTFHSSQTELDRWQRNQNVSGAFQLVDPKLLEGKHVLIVDDVITTGATITACASLIDDLPGTRISVAALAFANNAR